MPLDNQTATPDLQIEPFRTNNVITAAGAAPGAIAGASSNPEEPLSPSAKSSTGIEDEQPLWEGRYSAKNFLGRESSAHSSFSPGRRLPWRPGPSATTSRFWRT